MGRWTESDICLESTPVTAVLTLTQIRRIKFCVCYILLCCLHVFVMNVVWLLCYWVVVLRYFARQSCHLAWCMQCTFQTVSVPVKKHQHAWSFRLSPQKKGKPAKWIHRFRKEFFLGCAEQDWLWELPSWMLQSSLPFRQNSFLSSSLLLFHLLLFLDLLSCLTAEGGMNTAEYEAPAAETDNWAHGFMSREPALVNTFTLPGYLSGLLSSASEVGILASLPSFLHSFIHAFIPSFIHSLLHSFDRSFVRLSLSFPFFLHPCIFNACSIQQWRQAFWHSLNHLSLQLVLSPSIFLGQTISRCRHVLGFHTLAFTCWHSLIHTFVQSFFHPFILAFLQSLLHWGLSPSI